MAKIYALYKGDEYVTDGTLEELSRKTGKKEASLKFMTTPSYHSRIGDKALRLVSLGEESYVYRSDAEKSCRVTQKGHRRKTRREIV